MTTKTVGRKKVQTIEKLELFGVTRKKVSPSVLDTGINIAVEQDWLREQVTERERVWKGLEKTCPRLGVTISQHNEGRSLITKVVDEWRSPDIALIGTKIHDKDRDLVLRKGIRGYESIVNEVIGTELARASGLPVYRVTPRWDKQKKDRKTYVVMDKVDGKTLNELTYVEPEVLIESEADIARQLGRHAVFSYLFGVTGGIQTNYIFNPKNTVITRVSKERCFELPEEPSTVFEENDRYTQSIAAAEISNLGYIPSHRDSSKAAGLDREFEQGFYEQYDFYKKNEGAFLELVRKARKAGSRVQPPENPEAYEKETERIVRTIGAFIDQDPRQVLKRLFAAKKEIS